MKNLLSKGQIISIVVVVLFLLLPNISLAESGKVTLESPIGEVTPGELIGGKIIPAILGLVGVLAVAAIIYGGFNYVLSAGNEEKIKQAKNTITYAIIGLFLVLVSYIIIKLVISVVEGTI